MPLRRRGHRPLRRGGHRTAGRRTAADGRRRRTGGRAGERLGQRPGRLRHLRGARPPAAGTAGGAGARGESERCRARARRERPRRHPGRGARRSRARDLPAGPAAGPRGRAGPARAGRFGSGRADPARRRGARPAGRAGPGRRPPRRSRGRPRPGHGGGPWPERGGGPGPPQGHPRRRGRQTLPQPPGDPGRDLLGGRRRHGTDARAGRDERGRRTEDLPPRAARPRLHRRARPLSRAELLGRHRGPRGRPTPVRAPRVRGTDRPRPGRTGRPGRPCARRRVADRRVRPAHRGRPRRDADPGRTHRRYVHAEQLRGLRRRRLHTDRQPSRGGHARRRQDRPQALGARGGTGGAPGRPAVAHLRPPGVRRRHGGRLPAVRGGLRGTAGGAAAHAVNPRFPVIGPARILGE
ncbi:hypothetical protein SGPA1_50340 [Streptomyces misionensis JCM 4497]